MPDASLLWAIAAGAAAVAAAASGWGVFAVRGSTAVPAAAWAAAAASALATEMAVRAAGGLADPAAAQAARLGVAALGVCPAMSLLGAKRPQHGVWQFIVATLACVLALPAVVAVLVRPGTAPDIGWLWWSFLALLVAVGWMNFAGTRPAAAATLVAAGQFGLLRGLLESAAVATPGQGAAIDAAASVAIAAGAGLAAFRGVGSPPRSRSPGTLGREVDAPFLALRDTLGAAWALRIAERFDAIATVRGWPCRLRFGGLDCGGDPADGAWHRDAVRAFRSLARRFATPDWLRRHGGGGVW
jgi:uncharacterized membrane protein YhaH (DUF805 family)